MFVQKSYRFLIAGGGTGGHVFPAIAIADALKAKCPDAQFLFVGARGRLEMTKVPEAGYEIVGLNISGLQRGSIVANVSLPIKLITSLIQAVRILKKFRPNVVVGVGGYASVPAAVAAWLCSIPLLLTEQNSYAGLANRLLARMASKICVAFEGMERFFPREKIVVTGNPVRHAIAYMTTNKQKSLEIFGLSPERKTVLVVGGSLGAKTINEAIAYGLHELASLQIQLIWQTGTQYLTEAREKSSPYNWVRVYDFIKDMHAAYDAADIIISRAGAMAISELSLVKKPIILVPSSNVTDDHQKKNAEALACAGAALVVHDNEAEQILISTLIRLLKDEQLQQQLAIQLSKHGMPDAAYRIAEEIIKLTS